MRTIPQIKSEVTAKLASVPAEKDRSFQLAASELKLVCDAAKSATDGLANNDPLKRVAEVYGSSGNDHGGTILSVSCRKLGGLLGLIADPKPEPPAKKPFVPTPAP